MRSHWEIEPSTLASLSRGPHGPKQAKANSEVLSMMADPEWRKRWEPLMYPPRSKAENPSEYRVMVSAVMDRNRGRAQCLLQTLWHLSKDEEQEANMMKLVEFLFSAWGFRELAKGMPETLAECRQVTEAWVNIPPQVTEDLAQWTAAHNARRFQASQEASGGRGYERW